MTNTNETLRTAIYEAQRFIDKYAEPTEGIEESEREADEANRVLRVLGDAQMAINEASKPAPEPFAALDAARSFIEGFDGDESQEDGSIAKLIADLDAAKARVLAMNTALKVAWVRNSSHSLMSFAECNAALAAVLDTKKSKPAKLKAEPARIVIHVDGGIVQSVFSEIPVTYRTVDTDVEGSDGDDLTKLGAALKDATGQSEEALIGEQDAELHPEAVKEAFSA